VAKGSGSRGRASGSLVSYSLGHINEDLLAICVEAMNQVLYMLPGHGSIS
jgi:hypothetical protein